jgi:hypothetical protein
MQILAVSGPNRNLVCGSSYRHYLAMPYGDAGSPGCWGLLCAYAHLNPADDVRMDAVLSEMV